MEKVDSLSRRPDLKVGVENNNENQKLIKCHIPNSETCLRHV